jgi:hypothetical protein
MILGDVEPDLIGPFEDAEARDAEAKIRRAEEGDEHGYYMLDIPDDAPPSMNAYPGGFFEEDQ